MEAARRTKKKDITM